MQAVVRPFPIDETTPPVTKMYFVTRDSIGFVRLPVLVKKQPLVSSLLSSKAIKDGLINTSNYSPLLCF